MSTAVVDLPTIWGLVQERTEPTRDGCHLWTGATNSKGYGQISDGSGGTILVHRLALLVRDGSIPFGYVADHTCHDPNRCPGGLLCRHRRCVNQAHLEAVTIAENSRRGAQQNRATCKRNHLLGVRMRAGKPVRCCRRCEAIDRSARRIQGPA